MDVAQEMARRSHDALEQPQMRGFEPVLRGRQLLSGTFWSRLSLIESLDDGGSRALRADDRVSTIAR